ncbi:TPA: hypothetical protein ACH3X1_002027 [Trebouxia sp. C0004]
MEPMYHRIENWIRDHLKQPEGYLVFPSSKVSAFLSQILADCKASSSKIPHGAVKLARKALRHLRACQAGIPDDMAEFPSQPYITGVTSRAKTATAEARQWLCRALCYTIGRSLCSCHGQLRLGSRISLR